MNCIFYIKELESKFLYKVLNYLHPQTHPQFTHKIKKSDESL